MGKATRWLKRFLGIKKESSPPRIREERTTTTTTKTKTSCFPEPKHQLKSKWRNVKSCHRSEGSTDVSSNAVVVVDPSKEEIVVRSETVQTAVNPTGGEKGYGGFRNRKQWAAVTIQSYFRGYLARRARRALKGLVKLQALVRGNMVRKQTAHMMIRLEALLRAQARARIVRSQAQSHLLHAFSKSNQFDSHTQGPSTPENFELAISKRKNFSRLKSKLNMEQPTIELDEGSGKHDSPKPSINRKSPMKPFDRSNSSDQYSRIFTATSIDSAQSASSYEVQSLTPVKFVLYQQSEDNHLREPATPTRSINSVRSTLSHNPSYMSGTQSSRAKTRSSSAPKLRPGLERSTSTTKRVLSLHGYAAADQTKHFEKKTYPGSGQLDIVGMPYYVSEFHN